MVGYTRQRADVIADGNTIYASHFNDEYNAIATAFDAASGHTHDGSTGSGAPIAPGGLAGLTDDELALGVVIKSTGTSFTARPLTGVAGEVVITNGDGVGGDPTIGLPSTLELGGKTINGGTFENAILNSPSITGATVAGSETADQLTVARTISLSGDATGSVQFDGSQDVTLPVTVVDDSHSHVTADIDGLDTMLADYVLQSVYTGTEILTRLRSVDGSGSDLDADRLDGYEGSYYQPKATYLTSLGSLSATGFVVRNSSGGATARSINGASGRVSVSNATGITGNPYIDLAYSGVNSGTYSNATITVDSYGRVIGASSGAAIPSGVICMWAGSIYSIPSGWVLCDGNNGTPDLQDRFIVGAGRGYGVTATGGNSTVSVSTNVAGGHSHGGATADHALTIEQMPAHNHAITAGGGSSGPQEVVSVDSSYTMNYGTSWAGNGWGHSHGIYYDADHSHVSIFDNRPPYYALAFIAKL